METCVVTSGSGRGEKMQDLCSYSITPIKVGELSQKEINNQSTQQAAIYFSIS